MWAARKEAWGLGGSLVVCRLIFARGFLGEIGWGVGAGARVSSGEGRCCDGVGVWDFVGGLVICTKASGFHWPVCGGWTIDQTRHLLALRTASQRYSIIDSFRMYKAMEEVVLYHSIWMLYVRDLQGCCSSVGGRQGFAFLAADGSVETDSFVLFVVRLYRMFDGSGGPGV